MDSAPSSELSLPAKPKKPNRLGLYAPFLILLVAFGAWSLYWLYTSHSIAKRIELTQTDLSKAGYSVSHKPVTVRGYPFRMFIEIHDLKIISSTGRGLSSPLISAEANAYALDKWVFVAPTGFIWHRGQGRKGALGDVSISAEAKGSAIRASVSKLSKPIPVVAIEFLNPIFKSTNKEHPFGLSSADRFEAYWRPHPAQADTADFLWRVDGGQGFLINPLASNSKPAKFDWHIEGRMNKVAAFKGGDLTDRFNNWRNSGGTANDLKASLGIGEISMFMTSPALRIDADNSLRGQVQTEITGHGEAIAFLSSAKLVSPEAEILARPLWKLPQLNPQKPLKLTFDLKEGGLYAGPLRLSDAPAVP